MIFVSQFFHFTDLILNFSTSLCRWVIHYPDLQAGYRSGVGMLLFLIKDSRQDLANVVRELLKCMHAASHAAYMEMLRVMKCVVDTKQYCLKMRPIEEGKDWD
jgi:hypothetical protein